MKTIKLMMLCFISAGLAWGGPLTDESIRDLLKSRSDAFVQADVETIVALHTTNAVISASFFGMPGATSETDPREFGQSFSKGLRCVAYRTDPMQIEIAEDKAVVKADTQLAHMPSEKRKRIMTYRISEKLEIALIDGHLKITAGQMEITGQTLEPDELSKRIMKLIRQEGGINKETALKLLSESGCRYKEGDGKKKKSSISTPFNMECGDEIAALTVFVPGVQTLSLVGSTITDEGLADIGKIQTVETLYLMGSGISDEGIARLAELSSLETLSLMAVGITDASLERFADFPALKKLYLTAAPGVTDAGLRHLSKVETLESLTLTINMTDAGLKHLVEIPNLHYLRIKDAPITDAGLVHVEQMKTLTGITLNNTEVTYEGAKQLKVKRPKLRIGPTALIEPCADSRRKLEYAKKKWAEKAKMKAGAPPAQEDLEPLLKNRGGFESLMCEDGGAFIINPIGIGAECSIHGKTQAQKPTEPLEGLSKEDFDIDGAKPGRWTMDLDAAKKLAAEKHLPILLNFTGSDWCYWCKLMEKNVFTKPAWSGYATNNIVMVLIDFPRDKSAVPEKYKERNNALKAQYKISGYPTFVLLKPDGQTELARLKAGRDKTAKSFIGEIKELVNPEENHEN